MLFRNAPGRGHARHELVRVHNKKFQRDRPFGRERGIRPLKKDPGRVIFQSINPPSVHHGPWAIRNGERHKPVSMGGAGECLVRMITFVYTYIFAGRSSRKRRSTARGSIRLNHGGPKTRACTKDVCTGEYVHHLSFSIFRVPSSQWREEVTVCMCG